MRKAPLAALLLLFAAPVARADQIHLEGGRVIEGTAAFEGDKVVIALESGSISVPLASVQRIERSTSALAEADKREAALGASDLEGLLQLANFCRDHGLPAKERTLLQRVIALAPNHAEARRRLGYERTEAGWVERSELSRRQELARLQQEQLRLELAHKRAEVELAETKLARERQRGRERARGQMEASAPTSAPPMIAAPFAYYPPATMAGSAWTLTPPSVSAPFGIPAVAPFGIPGVRDPRDASFSLPGVREPQRYFDQVVRR